MDDLDAFLADHFHGCALVAFVEVAREQQAWPDSETVRRRAYRYYEQTKENAK